MPAAVGAGLAIDALLWDWVTDWAAVLHVAAPPWQGAMAQHRPCHVLDMAQLLGQQSTGVWRPANNRCTAAPIAHSSSGMSAAAESTAGPTQCCHLLGYSLPAIWVAAASIL